MEKNILCEKEEQTLLTGFFEELSGLLQDSDDQEEKERIKKALQKMTDTTTYMVLGEEGVGKTSLINAIFQDIFQAQDTMNGDICEYKWGEQSFETPVMDGVQKRFISSDDMKGLSVLDTRGINLLGQGALDKVRDITAKCNVIFVAFDAGNVRSSRVWDIVEKFSDKKMVFFLTKCDMVTQEILDKNMEKVKIYMSDAHISAPLFAISSIETTQLSGVSNLDFVRSYLRQQIIGKNPMLNKQRENIEEMKGMLESLSRSFELRKKQYQSDAGILQKINASLDDYVLHHKEIIDNLIKKLSVEVNEDIDKYEQEIISKLDPYKIKERFQNKDDFEKYLTMVNDNYKSMMNDSVNRKTIETMKGCLHDLEIIFQEAVGYFNKRENILALNDKFYGSMSQSKRQIVTETKDVAAAAGEFYQTLSEASETLFLQIWHERDVYDAKIRARKALSVVVGGGAGGAAAGVAGSAALAAGESAVLATIATAGIIVIGVIVGAVIVSVIAKKMFDSKAAEKMESNTRECIQQFKDEVNKTRKAMIEQITRQITELFEKELTAVDGYFTEFRISVNIEEQKIPLLEEKMKAVNMLMERIETL